MNHTSFASPIMTYPSPSVPTFYLWYAESGDI